MGAAWGAVLWLVASGLVMPIWLNIVGIATPVPNLSPNSLLAHLLWGTVLAIGTHVVQRGVIP